MFIFYIFTGYDFSEVIGTEAESGDFKEVK
jgi:hypothetical protein